MASSKDILDAQRFNRRRLVAAFNSGTPGGREVELQSPIGPLAIGIALTIIILVGAWIFGRFSPALPGNWANGIVITDSDTGAQYFTIDGTLHPVRNQISAQLLAAGPGLDRTTVDSSTLNDIPRGPEIGIVDGPAAVPTPELLANSGWIACPADDAAHVTIGGEVPAGAAIGGALVQHQGTTFLVAEGRRYEIAEADLATVRIALGWEANEITSVGSAWLDLFDLGSPVAPWSFDGAGGAAEMRGALTNAQLGTVVEVPDGQNLRRYLVVAPGTLAQITDFDYQLYVVGGGAQMGNALRASLADIAELTVSTDRFAPADWPSEIPGLEAAGTVPCAVLTESQGQTHSTLIQAVPPTQREVVVAGGTGALVRATSGGALGAIYVVSDAGIAYGLAGNEGDVVQRLGYQLTDVTNVPAPWVRLLPVGPTLSVEAAWATVPLT